MARLTPQDAEKFYADHKGKPYFKEMVSHLSSDLVVGLELIADNCVSKWKSLLGSPNDASKETPHSIRAKFGAKGVKNIAHGSDSSQSAAR